MKNDLTFILVFARIPLAVKRS